MRRHIRLAFDARDTVEEIKEYERDGNALVWASPPLPPPTPSVT